MRIEAHNCLGQLINADVTRVVVYDDHNNPVALAIKHRQDWIYVGHIRDPEFFDYLRALGIDKTVIVDILDPKQLPPLRTV